MDCAETGLPVMAPQIKIARITKPRWEKQKKSALREWQPGPLGIGAHPGHLEEERLLRILWGSIIVTFEN